MNLSKVFINDERFVIKISKPEKFYKDTEINFVNLPTTLLERFGSKPLNLESMVLKTSNQYNLPEFVVTMPNFTVDYNITNYLKLKYMIEAPLQAVLKFAVKTNMNIYYGLHTDYSFRCISNINLDLSYTIKEYFINILNEYNF